MLERATTSASEAPWRSPALVACRCSSVAKTSPSARTGTRLTAAYTANKRLVDGCPATDSPVVTRTESASQGRCRMPRVDYLPVHKGVRSGRGRGAGQVAEHQRPGALADIGADRLLLRRVLVGTGDHVAFAVTRSMPQSPVELPSTVSVPLPETVIVCVFTSAGPAGSFP